MFSMRAIFEKTLKLKLFMRLMRPNKTTKKLNGTTAININPGKAPAAAAPKESS